MHTTAGVFNLVVVLLIPLVIVIALRVKARVHNPPGFIALVFGMPGMRGVWSGLAHRLAGIADVLAHPRAHLHH